MDFSNQIFDILAPFRSALGPRALNRHRIELRSNQKVENLFFGDDPRVVKFVNLVNSQILYPNFGALI